MSRRALLLVATLALLLVPAASAAAASPWWQIVPTSRPTNLGPPKNEVQELRQGSEITLVFLDESIVACMGSPFCPIFLGLPNDETAAELQESLEAPGAYGPGNVEVSESPASSKRFLITSVGEDAGRYVSPISVNEGALAEVVTQGGSGRLAFTLINLGDAPVDATGVPLTITDALPPGVSAYGVEATTGTGISGPEEPAPATCELSNPSSLSCRFEGVLKPYEAIKVEAFVSAGGGPGGSGQISVSGANSPPTSAPQPVTLSGAPTPFGIEHLSLQAEAEGGATETQAGSHPFQLTTTLQLNQGPLVSHNKSLTEEQPGLPRNFRFKLPPGLVGNATAVPTCSYSDFLTLVAGGVGTNRCSAESAIGVASVSIIEPQNFHFAQLAVPVFNLPPSQGEPARFGFEVTEVPVVLDTAVRGGEAYGVGVSVKDTSETAQLLGSTVTLWGWPGDPRHDESRGWGCVYYVHLGGCSPPQSRPGKAFLRLPTSCGSPLDFSAEMEPWNVPLGSEISRQSFTSTALDGCDREPFEPSIDVQPDTHSGETPSGLNVHLKVPQGPSESPAGISESDVRNTRVTLPPGLKINPAAANGLQACSEQQVGFERLDPSGEAVFDEDPAACPQASKLGTVRVHTPLLEEDLTGSVYQAAQEANPFGSLLALYVVAEAPGAGVRVKLAGRVEPTASGQIVSSFEQTPQLPFEDFELSFFGGAGAPLATSGCGSYETQTRIEPWSGAAAATPSPTPFQVTSGPGGSACQNPLPFSPSFLAGTEAPLAGAFSPFVLRFGREDGTQQLGAIDTTLPRGLLGKLAGIPYCSEAAIRQAEARRRPGEGAIEQAHPSCAAASRVGTVKVAAGVGPNPYVVPGNAYLAGPYKGAPLSLAIVTPAVAGPFDLGTVVVRTALYVNRETAQITAKSDPLPTILEGIPLDLRSVSVKMDRPSFTLNPTNCGRMSVDGTAHSVAGQTATLGSPFQVGGCGGLPFAPKLSLRLFGPTHRSAHPRLRAVLRAKPGEANIARTGVTLPHSEFLEQSHIRTVCTRVQFNAGACPQGSVYGHAKAFSPLLDKPLEGPVYLRSNGGERTLPDLVAALHGQIDIDLLAYIDSVKGGIRTRFQTVPDAPVSRFVLDMRGGAKGLLVNSENLCSKRAKTRATVKMLGQNGKAHNFRPAVASRCRKHRGSSH
jgi:hypothetical protein